MSKDTVTDEGTLGELGGQVRLAWTAALLATVVALAVMIWTFGPTPAELIAARNLAEVQRREIVAHEQLLRDTESVVRQTQTELSRIRAARRASP